MGTRGTVTIKDSGKTLVKLYIQYDTYLSGLGAELKSRFGGTVITNGFGGKPALGDVANGMGCLAAQLIASLKDSVGNVYVTNPGAEGEEYNYVITGSEGLPIQVKVTNWEKKTIYSGPLKDLPTTED